MTTSMMAARGAQCVLAALVAMLFAAPPVQAQFTPSQADPEAADAPGRRPPEPAPTGPPARASDKLHAFTGSWRNDVFIPGIVAKGVIPLDDEHEAIRAQLEADRKAGKTLDGNEPKCIPNGPVMSMLLGLTIYATATELTVALDKLTRHIRIDQPHTPENLLLDSYAGESVAHWEGNDLVVDTVGVNPGVEIDWGIPLGERSKLHMIERFRIVGPSKMEIETVIEDPGVLTRPWKFTRHFTRTTPSLIENFCIPALDRNRDPTTGKPGLDLTPPKGTRYIPPGADR